MPHKRGPWSTGEDASLLTLVHHHGPQNWVRISQHLGSRSPKQCRERYHQNLKPSLNHSPITPHEGEMIENLVKQIGRRWADISRRLPGRSDNAVKNWWNGGVNRRRRVVIRRDGLGQPMETTFARSQSANMFPRAAPSSTIQRPLSGPIISPVRSEASMPDSMGDAPSLVSDHGSQQTIPSPRLHNYPSHLASTDGASIPSLWYCESRGPSDPRLQKFAAQHTPMSGIPSSLPTFNKPAATSRRLQQLSELAANEEIRQNMKFGHSRIEQAALSQTSDPLDDTSKLDPPVKNLYSSQAPNSAMAPPKLVRHYSGRIVSPNGGRPSRTGDRIETEVEINVGSGTVEYVDNLASHPAGSSLRDTRHAPSASRHHRESSAPSSASALCLAPRVQPTGKKDSYLELLGPDPTATQDRCKNKMTLSSILL